MSDQPRDEAFAQLHFCLNEEQYNTYMALMMEDGASQTDPAGWLIAMLARPDHTDELNRLRIYRSLALDFARCRTTTDEARNELTRVFLQEIER
jgi:hypothetical protein